jgi:hypothetical protein
MKDSFMGDAVGGDLRPAQVACKNGGQRLTNNDEQ